MQVLYYLKAASFVPQNKMNCLTTSNLYPHHLCKADTSSNWSEILQNPLIIETEPYFKVLTRFWTSKENFSAAVLALEHFVIHLLASIWGEKWFYLICTLLLYFITFNMEICFHIFSWLPCFCPICWQGKLRIKCWDGAYKEMNYMYSGDPAMQ